MSSLVRFIVTYYTPKPIDDDDDDDNNNNNNQYTQTEKLQQTGQI
jgi:hypothetical protein